MAKQKTNKTAMKRLKKSNPKGNRKAKLRFKESSQHHFRTKKSSRAKRRKNTGTVVYKGLAKKYSQSMKIK